MIADFLFQLESFFTAQQVFRARQE